MNLTHRSKPGRKKIQRDNDDCLICGGRAVGLNFGVQTCSPCKAFFRRNVVKLGTYEFRCQGDGDCPITSDTRRQCNCCRLAKCIRLGMNRNAIRTEDQRLERLQLIEYNRQKQLEKNSLMIRSSNLLNYKTSFLTMNDQSLLANIFSAYEQTCVKLRNQYYNIPNDNTLSLQKFMNSCAHMYMALIQYIKYIPEFSNLSITSKKFLIKNNLNQIFRLNNALVIKATGIVDDPNSICIMHLFPQDLFIELCKCTISIFPYLSDPILLKLILIVLIFSTHLNIQYDNQSINNENEYSTLKMFTIQNIYVELLWRYILYRCSDFQQAVQLFSSFITRLIYSQYINIKLNEHVSKITSSQADQLEPIMKAMWLNDQN